MKNVLINARIPVGLKKAVTEFCDARGLKVQAFIENLIQERLEDELDHAAIDARAEESTVSLEAVRKGLKLDRDSA